MTTVQSRGDGTSSQIRGIIYSGKRHPTSYSNTIEYITLSTEGNAQDFGDLAAAALSVASCASSTRAVQTGGSLSGGSVNTMQYVTISTTGNAADFGDMTAVQSALAALSDVNGGLG